MIVFSKEKLLPTISNIMRLENDNGYFYVFQDTYDSCVILHNRYSQEELLEKITSSRVNIASYEKLKEALPPPINVLAGFILLIKDEIDADISELCGALSEIVSYMNLTKFIISPMEVRKSISYSKNILTEYQLTWKKFIQMCIKWEDIEKLLEPKEIQPEEKQVPYLPLYMVPQNGMLQQQFQQPVVEEKKGDMLDNVSFEDDGIYIKDDDSDLDEYMKMLEATDNKMEEKKASVSNVSEVKDNDEPSKLEGSDIAGFDAQKDYDKAIDLVKPKLSARGGEINE